MSTKTNFKRIALVAIAALGLGVLSSVPSQAAVSNIEITVVDGTATTTKSDTTTAATVRVKALFGSATLDSATVSVVLKSGPTGYSTALVGLLQVIETTPGSVVNPLVRADQTTAITRYAPVGGTTVTPTVTDSATSVTPLFIRGVTTANQYNGFDGLLFIDTTGAMRADQTPASNVALIAGTYVYTVVVTPYASLTGAAGVVSGSTAGTAVSKDVSIVVSAPAAASTTPSATYTYVDISADTGAGNAVSRANTTDAVISSVATAGTASGSIFVGVRNSSDSSTVAKESITATVAGAGLICAGTLSSATAGSCGKSLTVAATGDYQFLLRADGTAGLSTITVTTLVAGVSAVKTLNYYSVAAKTLTASVFTPILIIGSNDSAVSVKATDSAGTDWAGQAYIYASAAADATAVGGSATTPVACTYRASNTTHYCPITATAAGTGKFKVIDAATVALATATSNELTVKSSNATAASLKIAFNKASYAPGEIGQITITPVDASGADIAATTLTNGLASGGVTSNLDLTYAGIAVSGLTAAEIVTSAYTGTALNAGKKTFVFSAPMTGGTLTVTAKGGTSLPTAGQVTITASATITDNGAAALAAVNALATTVASLKTLITTLTNLVLKIQKKVKA